MNKPHTAVPSLAGQFSRGNLKVAGATLALALAAALAPARAEAADAAHGKALADSHNCAACHGANLNKPVSPEYPKLAGQHSDYIYWALRQYQMGNGNPHLGRNNPIMQAQVQSLSQSDMKDIAAYIESLKGDLIDKK
ncbi:c-type cytochrome [Paraburkholderia acidisoli]|uniref:C-type cytochrome n=1 Tax=Paraburkholderia acidisoli TaxID=2571748 RepID=A0A7Z2GGG3_9BURK|nr:cytochrome c [Paraburkholderia acidisoli]QGZ60964.1 c-type cytochrome [Paraburkholderia acidisoli]